jgi:uncharacterized protein
VGLTAVTVTGFGLLAGLLIGAAGIGGVVLVPSLVFFAGIPVHTAISAAMLSFILTGLIGTFLYAKAGSIQWELTAWLSAGAAPAALAGAFAASLVSGAWLEAGIGLLALVSGLNAFFRADRIHAAPAKRVSNAALFILGAVTGFVSAMTGTGGPLVLVPLLLWLECPVLTAVGLSQVIQLPVSLLATAGNFYGGTIAPALGALLSLGVPAGIWLGAKIAHSLPRALLRRAIAMLLAIVGALILGKVAVQSFL